MAAEGRRVEAETGRALLHDRGHVPWRQAPIGDALARLLKIRRKMLPEQAAGPQRAGITGKQQSAASGAKRAVGGGRTARGGWMVDACASWADWDAAGDEGSLSSWRS